MKRVVKEFGFYGLFAVAWLGFFILSTWGGVSLRLLAALTLLVFLGQTIFSWWADARLLYWTRRAQMTNERCDRNIKSIASHLEAKNRSQS